MIAIVFGVNHLYQGVDSAIGTGVQALLFILIYLRRRRILEAVAAHAVYDIIGITIAYLIYLTVRQSRALGAYLGLSPRRSQSGDEDPELRITNAKKRAVVAVARKLAVLLHRLWVSAEVYEPLRNPADNPDSIAQAVPA